MDNASYRATSRPEQPQDLEAKIVVLGAQGVGKTSLLNRFIHHSFTPTQTPTIGANFLTKRLLSTDTSPPTSLKLQIWDTAGQERFRSISKLYYRGANAALLCYDITDEGSFREMGSWMEELRANLGREVVVHVVGMKADVVAEEPGKRQVAFERCIQYVSENLPERRKDARTLSASTSSPQTPGIDPRHSGFWGSDTGWDSCHEISAKDGDGIEEMFRVLIRKLVEQQHQRERELQKQRSVESAKGEEQEGYFDRQVGKGSFRLGDKRRSWLAFPSTPGASASGEGEQLASASRCCGT